MHVLSQADCLALWESGRTLHPLDQGLLAVQEAFPETQRESIADWPLGRRNRALAELRCACFGRWLRGWAACRQCGEKLEFEVDGKALAESHGAESDEPIQARGMVFHLPTSRDLARIAGEHDPSTAALHLLEQCMEPAGDSPALEWTKEDLDAVGESMALADPLAEILLQFDCPACGGSFQETLDLAEFLWAELEGRAKRLLLDVHTLATAYGWSEAQILALSPARREFYIERIQA